MRFSFSATNTALRPEDDEAMVASEIAQVLLADELGFDMVKFGERHFGGYGVANPLQLLAAVAPRLRRAWVGTGITVAADHHPVRLAEMINVLDHLARGRSIVGIGSGMSPADALAFGFDSVTQKAAMLAECLDALEVLWAKRPADPPVTIQSSVYRGTLIERISPSPFRKARPHLKISASTDQAIERAVRNGWPVYLGPGTAEQEGPLFARYRAALLAAGHGDEVEEHCLGWTSAVTLGMHIAETDAQAQDEARWLIEPVKKWSAEKQSVDAEAERRQGLAPNEARLKPVVAAPGEDFWSRFVVTGGPETIARRVRAFADLGVGLFQVALVGQTDADRRAVGDKALRLFAAEVIPRFRADRADATSETRR